MISHSGVTAAITKKPLDFRTLDFSRQLQCNNSAVDDVVAEVNLLAQ
jgi:hypothetical protein